MSGVRTALRLLPVVLSAVLLAAHFSRAGSGWLVALSLAFPLLLLVRDGRAVRLVQGILVLGGLEWVRTAVRIAEGRVALGEPWLRMALILGGVALFTWASALVFRAPALRRIWFRDS
ncbi:MAG: hypothetical protein RRA92_00555 [Gemmatimonadota bacterium]|nr:hypothetical protein [Gemmatimonadota bacterium]